MNKKQIAAITLTLWLTIVFIFMLLLQRFDLEIFFVLTLIGILVIAELIKQQYVQPSTCATWGISSEQESSCSGSL